MKNSNRKEVELLSGGGRVHQFIPSLFAQFLCIDLLKIYPFIMLYCKRRHLLE